MIQTQVFYPTNPEKFRRNMRRRSIEYSGKVAHYNSGDITSEDILIYHVADATVFVAGIRAKARVNLTANVSDISLSEIETAKTLLEEISKVRLLER